MSRSSARTWIAVAAVVTTLIGVTVAVWAFLKWLQRPLTAVPRVDLDRLAGSWYPIAGSPKVDRRLGPGEIVLSHQGLGLLDIDVAKHSSSGEVRKRVVALATDGGGVWKLDGGPLGRTLQVLALAPDYSACLLGSPDRSVAVILSRTRSLDRSLWRHFTDELARQDFATNKLRQVSGTRVRLSKPAEAPRKVASPESEGAEPKTSPDEGASKNGTPLEGKAPKKAPAKSEAKAKEKSSDKAVEPGKASEGAGARDTAKASSSPKASQGAK
ncbi:MAG: hypothetical protein EA397_11595 [Deltaproteobacteria bacterium]|nr:MAG: hypothetical protein EA397_11595 [Deltaproteobacteria bacterium]